MSKENTPKFRNLVSLEDFKKELPKIKQEWKNLLSTKAFPFSEYTNSKIRMLEKILYSDLNEAVIQVKSLSLISELDNIHFKGNITLENIFAVANSSERVQVFITFNHLLTDSEYWEKLADSYLYQDYTPVPYDVLRSLFTSKKSGQENLMTKEEREFFEKLPHEFEIFRSMSENEFQEGNYRFSWTLDPDIAEFFSKRSSLLYGKKMIIHAQKIKKHDALAYFNRREEEEIIYLPN